MLVCHWTCSIGGPICSHAHIWCLGLHLWMIRLGTKLLPPWSLCWIVSTPPCSPLLRRQLTRQSSLLSVSIPWCSESLQVVVRGCKSPLRSSQHGFRPTSLADTLFLYSCTLQVGLHGLSAFPRISFLQRQWLSCRPYISKMYFSLWKPPGASDRMWSVSLEASISGEYQTPGGHSGRPSE